MDDAELEDFIATYTDACAAAGVEPLPPEDLAVIANAVLTGVRISAIVTGRFGLS